MIPLRDIRRRIKSVERISHITRAMKTVSAIRLMKVQTQVLKQKPYATELRAMVGDLVARTSAQSHPLLKPQTAGPEAGSGARRIVVFGLGSDRGLCGPFNNNLMAECIRSQRSNRAADVRLVVFGKKLHDLLKARNVPIAESRIGFVGSMTYDVVAKLAGDYLAEYQAGTLAELWAVYTEFASRARQRVVRERLLPIGLESIPAEPLFPEYVYEPDPFAVLDRVLPMYYNREVWRVFLESAASEHIARMLAMDMATVSAGEMIRSLTLSYNKARQESITRELSEISSAAEAFRTKLMRVKTQLTEEKSE